MHQKERPQRKNLYQAEHGDRWLGSARPQVPHGAAVRLHKHHTQARSSPKTNHFLSMFSWCVCWPALWPQNCMACLTAKMCLSIQLDISRQSRLLISKHNDHLHNVMVGPHLELVAVKAAVEVVHLCRDLHWPGGDSLPVHDSQYGESIACSVVVKHHFDSQ